MAVNNFCHFTLLKTEEAPDNCVEKCKQEVDVLREDLKEGSLTLKG